MNPWIFLTLFLLAAPAFGQTMYKCTDDSGVVKYQQMPCTPTGGGEPVIATPIKSSGDGLRDSERNYLDQQEKQRQSPKDSASNKSGEVEKECFVMKRRILEMEDRERRGIHTWSKHGYEESQYRKQEYEKLCGPW
ncbi:MAG: DUF4124 domain-containing protein [Candidatus Contendobacter sp.]|nr:DUF4124 domain-containing protein [Candidatus Contendobacter sp.]